jgi:hypothetical protein
MISKLKEDFLDEHGIDEYFQKRSIRRGGEPAPKDIKPLTGKQMRNKVKAGQEQVTSERPSLTEMVRKRRESAQVDAKNPLDHLNQLMKEGAEQRALPTQPAQHQQPTQYQQQNPSPAVVQNNQTFVMMQMMTLLAMNMSPDEFHSNQIIAQARAILNI